MIFPLQVAAAPELDVNTSLATAGYFQLSWQDPSSTSKQYELQQAKQNNFSDAHTLYLGADESSVISGLSDDIYYFRIRNNNSAWSNTIEVEVKHHSLSRAFGFFSLGAVMLIVTLIVLIKGARGRN